MHDADQKECKVKKGELINCMFRSRYLTQNLRRLVVSMSSVISATPSPFPEGRILRRRNLASLESSRFGGFHVNIS